MANFKLFTISKDFKIKVVPDHFDSISADLKKEIDDIWNDESSRRKNGLFNGKILSAIKYEGDELFAKFVDYKVYLAQLSHLELEKYLKIKPICVNGLTRCQDFILFGKRSLEVTQYQNCYELVPSGGLDPSSLFNEQIDIRQQILSEFEEETGIEEFNIENIVLRYLIYDPAIYTYEICAELTINPMILQKKLTATKEYTDLFWLSKKELKNFISTHEKNFVPLSIHLLKLSGFLCSY